MIVELAQLTIIAGREAEFESVFRTAISTAALRTRAEDCTRSSENGDRRFAR
jgi:hypothetical protein